MIISEKLNHTVQNRLQLLMSYIETEQFDKAKSMVREISMLINSRVITETQKESWRRLLRALNPDMDEESFNKIWAQFELGNDVKW